MVDLGLGWELGLDRSSEGVGERALVVIILSSFLRHLTLRFCTCSLAAGNRRSPANHDEVSIDIDAGPAALPNAAHEKEEEMSMKKFSQHTVELFVVQPLADPLYAVRGPIVFEPQTLDELEVGGILGALDEIDGASVKRLVVADPQRHVPGGAVPPAVVGLGHRITLSSP